MGHNVHGMRINTTKENLVKEENMEKLKELVVAKIASTIENESNNIQLLDVLNRILGTVCSDITTNTVK